MWTFFQIERRYFNHWILGIWSSLNESALRNCEAEIIIHSNDGREYQVKMKIILTQSTCKTITSEIGFHLLLMQSQLFNTPGLPHEKNCLIMRLLFLPMKASGKNLTLDNV